MKTPKNETVQLLIACVALFAIPVNVHAWSPNVGDLDAAIENGDFSGYFTKVSTWLDLQAPADPGSISEAAMKALLKDPAFVNALDQRRLLSKLGIAHVGAFAQADRNGKTFLAWLLRNTAAMDLYLEGATPTGIADREADGYTLNAGFLDIWKSIFFADPESKEGLYLKLAIATALSPPGTGNRGAGMSKTPTDPLSRYQHFKAANVNGELFPSFSHLTVWEYRQVVSSCASDKELTWAREMLNAWRPDLRIDEQVVNSTSEVWRRNSPIPYTDFKTVLEGGGKCGPRSSWSVMICQAFGIPAIGVGQPAHACVAYKSHNPLLEPQPGSVWKVAYGRGWQVSKLEGLSGPDFLAGVEERSRVVEFSQVEHLRWLASAIASTDRAAAILRVARQIQQSVPAVKTDLAASEKAAEAEKELQPDAKASQAPSTATNAPLKVLSGGTRVEAAAFSKMSGVCVYDCYTGGKQVNFQKNMEISWIDYVLDVPATGIYGIEMRIATPNRDQVLDVSSGTKKLANVKIPNTTGLWVTTQTIDLSLDKGIHALRISAPFQRGIAIRWFELKPKGTEK